MNNNLNDKFEGYKFEGIVDEFQPMGDKLRPVHEMEIADLSDPNQVEQMIGYLSKLGKDPEVKNLQQQSHPQLTVHQKQQMFKEDPSGSYIVKDGKRVSLAQYRKNKKSMNSRNNFNFQKEGDPRFADGNKNAQKTPPKDYNSMVFHNKKVK
jgi:hypothetical protein